MGVCNLTQGGLAEEVGFEPTQAFKPLEVFKTTLLNRLSTPPYLIAVFGGNGKTHYASGGVSSILDSLQTIIGNILRFVDL